MNDESKKKSKKLRLFRKWINNYEYRTIGIDDSMLLMKDAYRAAFEEMLKIVDQHAGLEGYDRDNALLYVRRAILDELGETDDEQENPKLCNCNYYGLRTCGLKAPCNIPIDNGVKIRLKSCDNVLAEARKKAAERAYLPIAARKFYGVTIRNGRVGFEKKQKSKCDHEYSTIATRIDMTRTLQCTKCGDTIEQVGQGTNDGIKT